MPWARAIKVRNGKYYKSNAENIRSRKRDNYQNNPQNRKDASRASYMADPNKTKQTARKQYRIAGIFRGGKFSRKPLQLYYSNYPRAEFSPNAPSSAKN